ncbi:hypothetical protein RZS08_51565, partial [Arthrospira platensis SPKY1]|nr:hypothetical protein [Arthrospira platensis SPKY1]
RVYNKPNEVYTAGFLGLQSRASGTYISRLLSPDTSKIHLDIMPKGSAALCKGVAEARPQGGIAPYSYKWLYPTELMGTNEFKNLCEGDSVYVEVSDSRGHIAHASL